MSGSRVPQQRSLSALRGPQVLAAMSSEQVRAGPPGSRVPGARRAGAVRTAPSGNLYSSTTPASSVSLLFPSQPLDRCCNVIVTTGTQHSRDAPAVETSSTATPAALREGLGGKRLGGTSLWAWSPSLPRGVRDLLFAKPSHPKLAWNLPFRPGWP